MIKIPKIPPPTKAISDKYIVNLQAAINWDIMIPSGLPKMFILLINLPLQSSFTK